ncbi:MULTISPECIES: hypothetical protein [unclassified Arcicella]|uniref:hypothetical protein n=1 Tax=unclassified Arcicella TaxID=2644986 RepID=UPI0028638BB6|nr:MULTISPECIES: hypothetical protein [unclassified Arcicella]MDR6560752.1 hypothetical protein [Arcicella sp. BE51]MDR6810636.1 hypothetical protein [Arcicella sp. BE140]MDR6821986.1 hypothetical protein [Arcicella sp. BE139]
MKKLFYFLLTFGITTHVIAQSSPSQTPPILTEHIYGKNSIGIQFGTMGFGAEVAQALKRDNSVNLRVGFSYLDVSMFVTPPITVSLGDGASDLDISPKVKSLQIDALIDFHPFKRKSFKLVGGLAYGTGDSEVMAEPTVKTGKFKFASDFEIDAQDFGKANLKVTGNKIRPYLGIGFGRAIPKSRVGFGFEMGAYYSGSPKLTLDRSGVVETLVTDANILSIENNVKNYAFIPKLSFTVRIKL